MSKSIKFALAGMPQSAKVMIATAQAAERLGFWGFGVGDGPFLHLDTYPVTTACMLETDHIRLGPFGTNTVTRHWTTHAASARTFAELTPGRFFIGVAVGDGAVRSVGLKPMKWADLADSVHRMRERVAGRLRRALPRVRSEGLRGRGYLRRRDRDHVGRRARRAQRAR